MTKILFVKLPNASLYKNKNLTLLEPLGLEYLISNIEDKYNVDLVDLDITPQEELNKYIEQNQIEFVGTTVSTPMVLEAKKLVDTIKQLSPSTKVIIGGGHPTALPKESLKSTGADIAVVGEGELVLNSILDGTNTENVVYGLHCDVNKLNFPTRNLVPREHYKVSYSFDEKELQKCASVITSRGCPFLCLRGDNKIITLNGEYTIKELTESNTKPKILTRNPITLEPEFATPNIIFKTRKMASLIRVYFDDNTHIDCTPDHKFMVFKNGNQFVNKNRIECEIEAQNLKIGQSVVAINFRESKYGYNIIEWGRRHRKPFHRLLMEGVLGRKLHKDEYIHHIDKNKLNNNVKNLRLTTIKEHISKYHPEVSERMKGNNNPIHKMSKEYRSLIGKKNIGKKRSLETRLKLRLSKLGNKNPMYKKFPKNKRYKRKSRIFKDTKNSYINHKVVKVEWLKEKEDVYCMEVPGYNWFYANNVLIHNCNYCSSKTIHGSKVRFRNIDNIIAELEELINVYKIESVLFLDDSFSLKEDRVIELCKEIIKRNLRFYWWVDTRVDCISEFMLGLMRDAGCRFIVYGVESGSQKVLDSIGKKIKIEDIKKTFKLTHEAGIATKANFMLGHLDETEEDIIMSIELAKELNATRYGFYLVLPLPGSPLYNIATEKNLITKSFDHFKWYDVPVSDISKVSSDRLIYLQKKAYNECKFK